MSDRKCARLGVGRSKAAKLGGTQKKEKPPKRAGATKAAKQVRQPSPSPSTASSRSPSPLPVMPRRRQARRSGGARTKKASLYDRLGGIYAIAAVVDYFSDLVVENPIAGKNSPNPFLRDWTRNQTNRLPGLKWMRTLWVADITGGPYKFIATKPGSCPLGLESAHAKFHITPAEFDAVAGELANALAHFDVPTKEKTEVLAAFLAHKPEINAPGGRLPARSRCPFA